MTRFLAVSFRTVVDTPAVESIPAIPGSPAVMSESGQTELVPAVPEIPEVPAVVEVSHEEVDAMWIEDNVETVAQDMAEGRQRNRLDVDYYELVVTRGTVITRPVTIKSGPRASAPAREVVEIEAQGKTIGSTEIDA